MFESNLKFVGSTWVWMLVGMQQIRIGRFKHAHLSGQLIIFEHLMSIWKQNVVISLAFSCPNHFNKMNCLGNNDDDDSELKLYSGCINQGLRLLCFFISLQSKTMLINRVKTVIQFTNVVKNNMGNMLKQLVIRLCIKGTRTDWFNTPLGNRRLLKKSQLSASHN